MAIENARQAMKAMGSPYGKTVQELKALAIRHWSQWQPKMVKKLKAENRLNSVALAAAEKTDREIKSLMSKGFQHHEAEEMVMQRYILLRPEQEVNDRIEAGL